MPDTGLAAAVAAEGLCDRCLGRMFAKMGTGMTNDVRGRLIREAAGTEEVDEGSCSLCGGLFADLDLFADAVAEEVNGVESDNFLVGSKVDPAIAEKEKAMIL